MHSTHPQSKSEGFTLIELLTVIAIIGILAAILIPTVGAVRESARSTRAISNVKQIGFANLMHANDNRGRTFGQGTDPNINDDSIYMFRSVSRYATTKFNSQLDNVANSIAPLVDPAVPAELLNYAGGYPWTWSINSIFNIRQGRFYQGIGTWLPHSGSADRIRNARRVEEFQNPSKVIFAVSGGFEFNTARAADETLLATPTARRPIFYLHRKGRATPAVFLDGHTELLSFPINPALIIPQ